MSAGARPALSRYRGLRVTLTQIPGRAACLVQVAAKQEAGKWDDWSLLFPALRVEAGTIANAYEAVEVIREALESVSRELE